MGNPDSNTSQKSEPINLGKELMPRENLISTAVTFLSDKKIQTQDQSLLKKFLLKKGLTEEEAAIAFQRVQATKSGQNLGLGLVQQFVPPMLPPAPPPLVPSRWQTIHNIITTVTSIGGILYALYWLWKTYISPYLFGRKPKRKPVETSIAELENVVGSCADDLKSVRSSLQVLTDQKATELTNSVIVSRIQEVKSEISSLKALLLNRNQFPAAPPPVSTSPLSIPAWQLSAEHSSHVEHGGEGEGEEEGSGSNGTTNGSDSSLEIVKDPNN